MRNGLIILDSNDRFEDHYEVKPFWKLPHNKHGFNYILVKIDDHDNVIYHNKVLFNLGEYKQYAHHSLNQINDNDDDGGNKNFVIDGLYDYYNLFLTNGEGEDEEGENIWNREPINFDGILITDAHVCLFVAHDSVDIVFSENFKNELNTIFDPSKSLAISGTLTFTI